MHERWEKREHASGRVKEAGTESPRFCNLPCRQGAAVSHTQMSSRTPDSGVATAARAVGGGASLQLGPPAP